jgi:hypothetical protein
MAHSHCEELHVHPPRADARSQAPTNPVVIYSGNGGAVDAGTSVCAVFITIARNV